MPAVPDQVAVIIPTLDEQASIGPVVRAIPRAIAARVLVADGGSRDGTVAQALAAGAEVVPAGRGYGRACLAGAEHAQADILVFMDGDGADDPASIAALVGPIAAGTHDFVIGSRVRGQREPGSMAWHQVVAGRIAGWLIGRLYGVRYTDMCAFRAIRRETLLALGMQELGYGWNLEMQMRAARAGLRIRELPVPYRRRLGGTSKVAGSLRGTLRAGTRIIATFWRVAAGPRGNAHAMRQAPPLPACGERSAAERALASDGRRVRGTRRESEPCGSSPSPDLLRAKMRSQIDLSPQAGRGGAGGDSCAQREKA